MKGEESEKKGVYNWEMPRYDATRENGFAYIRVTESASEVSIPCEA